MIGGMAKKDSARVVWIAGKKESAGMQSSKQEGHFCVDE